MKSPIGTHKPLEPFQLENSLTAYRCPESGGCYIPASSYMRWISQQPARLPQLPPADETIEDVTPSGPALLCPETGTIMTRYRVGHGFRFTIDRSITGGVWLDAGECEALRSRNFHDEIHFVFTEPWQREARAEEQRHTERNRLSSQLGDELFGKVERLKADLKGNPHRERIIAYLVEDE